MRGSAGLGMCFCTQDNIDKGVGTLFATVWVPIDASNPEWGLLRKLDAVALSR
jgi:hypothetical protein